jgi:hypothetical protein
MTLCRPGERRIVRIPGGVTSSLPAERLENPRSEACSIRQKP